jgi:hypothetical protein
MGYIFGMPGPSRSPRVETVEEQLRREFPDLTDEQIEALMQEM